MAGPPSVNSTLPKAKGVDGSDVSESEGDASDDEDGGTVEFADRQRQAKRRKRDGKRGKVREGFFGVFEAFVIHFLDSSPLSSLRLKLSVNGKSTVYDSKRDLQIPLTNLRRLILSYRLVFVVRLLTAHLRRFKEDADCAEWGNGAFVLSCWSSARSRQNSGLS